MNNTPFFSIIVPAHNSEKYISTGLESIQSQTFQDYELIVPCDSCDDNTSEVARSFGANVFDVNFHQDGRTRNAGLEVATGEWILFMDDDDWFLHEYAFELLAGMVGKHDEDALCFSFIARNYGYIRQLPEFMSISPCVWSKCWKHEFIKNIRFSTRKYWSDCDFHNKAMKKPHRFAYWDIPIYYYNRTRAGSQSEYANMHQEDWKSQKPAIILLTDSAEKEKSLDSSFDLPKLI